MEEHGSILLIEELFEHADPRFVPELLKSRHHLSGLRPLAQRWLRDKRPFARKALVKYIRLGTDLPGHRPLIKKLFKLAEEAGDEQLMLQFMVAFDRLVDRSIVKFLAYDPKAGRFRPAVRRVATDQKKWRSNDQFSLRTRMYLGRRVYRFFRRIGFRDPERYGALMRQALYLYAEEDVPSQEVLLDRWSLFHVLYWSHPAFSRRPHQIVIHKGHTLTELGPAPHFPDSWRSKDALGELLSLLGRAQNAIVREWIIEWVKSEHLPSHKELKLSLLWPVFQSPHLDVQSFSQELVSRIEGPGRLSSEDWTKLLATDNEAAIPELLTLFETHVRPERIQLQACVALVKEGQSPVAMLMLQWIQAKSPGPEEYPVLLGMLDAKAHDARKLAAQWLCSCLGAHPAPLLLREVLDSPHQEVRAQALDLVRSHAAYNRETRLAVAMAESPYSDVRDALVASLEHWQAKLEPSSVHHLFARTLLSVRNGGRPKQAVLRHLSEAVLQEPARTEELMPLLAIALRSIRGRERRFALAAIAKGVFARPQIRQTVERLIPELSLTEVHHP